MLARITLTILIFLGGFVESTLFPFPFMFLFSAFYFFFFEDILSFLTIFLGAILLDGFLFHALGFTALFLFALFVVTVILEKVFLLHGVWALITVLLIGEELYRHLAGYPFFPGPFVALLAGLILFALIEKKNTRKGEYLHA